jgi:hypothetical protein
MSISSKHETRLAFKIMRVCEASEVSLRFLTGRRLFLFSRKVNRQAELTCVNPKLKCNPNAQSRGVTYLRRIQSSPLRSLASIAPHSGQSSQLFLESTHGDAQFLSKVARSALVPQAIHIPHRVANPLAIAPSGQSRNFFLMSLPDTLDLLQWLRVAVSI